ncbi:MAG: DUF1648 domain-containing protein [Erysipelotrichaceae bacterium]|nr:DUF1648 domain-containing protein [Erysipelotrichaceae bacterium]
MNRKTISIILIAIGIILAAVGYVILPEVVAVQVGFDGSVANTMPKLLAIGLPLLITIVGSVINVKEDDNRKGLVLAIAGIVVMVITLLFNCR